MNGHFTKRCVGCKIIYAQCRCPDQTKTEEQGVCGTCRYKWICGKEVNPEVQKHLEKLYPHET